MSKGKRTWMKVVSSGGGLVEWLEIEHDFIVSGPEWIKGIRKGRADDTLSYLSLRGWKIEGPFSEPE